MTAALFDHLWQSTLFGGCIALSMPFLRGNSASIRYGLWLAASLKFLFPLCAFGAIGKVLSPFVPVPAASIIVVIRPAATPFTTIAALPAGLGIADWLLLGWVAGVVTIALSWLLRWRTVNSALRTAQPLISDAPVPICCSHSRLEPGLVGIFNAVILLPRGITQFLSPHELQAVIAHEVCHLRRRDNVTGALHLVSQTVFWFFPPIWWIGTRLVHERELACDELVLQSGVRRVTYAEAILKVCRFYIQSPLPSIPGVSGGALEARMTYIMTDAPICALQLQKKAALAAFGVSLVAMAILAGVAPLPIIHLLKPFVSATARAGTLTRQLSYHSQVTLHRTVLAKHILAPRVRIVPELPILPAVADTSALGKIGMAVQAAPISTANSKSTIEPNGDAAATTNPVRAIQPSGKGAPDAVTCRVPQQLPGSRLPGPEVCKQNRVWAELRRLGEDINPEGTYTQLSHSGILWHVISRSL
jgi:beta-lactamase regulating signal transducer with metallopeptidase domain